MSAATASAHPTTTGFGPLRTVRLGLSRVGYEVRSYFRQGDTVFFTFLFPLVMLTIFSIAFSDAEFGRTPDGDPMTAIKAFCRVKFNKPSMLQHLEASRETEIAALNGAVVRLGAELGIPTPYNQAITFMVEAMQHHRIKMRLQPDIDYEALEKDAKARAKL